MKVKGQSQPKLVADIRLFNSLGGSGFTPFLVPIGFDDSPPHWQFTPPQGPAGAAPKARPRGGAAGGGSRKPGAGASPLSRSQWDPVIRWIPSLYIIYIYIYCFWGHVILSQHVSTPRPTRRLAQGSSFSLRHPNLAIASASRARRRGDLVEKVTTGSPAGGVGPAGCGSGLGVVGSRSGLLCLLRCIVCLLVLLLCACFRLSLPLLGLFIFWLKAPCSGSFVVPAEGPLCPWDWGT